MMDYNKLKNDPDVCSIFIAEAGINHDGNLATAKKMVDQAVRAEADYVKFQSFKADKLVTPDALTSSYIDQGSHQGESFRDLLKRLELSKEDQKDLAQYCKGKKIKFLSTAFDADSFDYLLELGIDVVKVASADLTNIPFLRHMAASKLPIILSTGMATLGEIEEAVDSIVNKEGNKQLILMHCISWYPAEHSTANLRFMDTLKKAFGFPVGFSDHTLGINMSIAARAMGAVVLEKHFTLDAKQFGPDHAASIEPKEMIELVKGLRQVEVGLGSSNRLFGEKEIGQRKVHRRSIVVAKTIKNGEMFSSDNLIIKRPGIGMKPKHWDAVLGKKASRDLKPEQLLGWADLAI
jgi:N,N'-diacetyllegionaminate synthase